MKRKLDPLDDFTVINREPTPEEDRLMKEFIKKDKLKRERTKREKPGATKSNPKLKAV
jgi:hypothetical protein